MDVLVLSMSPPVNYRVYMTQSSIVTVSSVGHISWIDRSVPVALILIYI